MYKSTGFDWLQLDQSNQRRPLNPRHCRVPPGVGHNSWDSAYQARRSPRLEMVLRRPILHQFSLQSATPWVLLSSTISGCNLVWKTWTPLWVKIFLWLALRRKQWTMDRRHHNSHGLQAVNYCYLCDQEPEDIDHLTASCSFSMQIW